MNMNKPTIRGNQIGKILLGASLGAALGWTIAQQNWVLRRLAKIDVPRSLKEHTNQAAKGLQWVETHETPKYIVRHTVEDGIERIVYTPMLRRFDTPILMQHGMWHAAWCWQPWQECLAERGWESHAVSLPGHGGSLEQRPISLCTLDYYLGFLCDEIDRLGQKPVLIGHSMGGALAQWYLKYVGDDLPAEVLVAPWVSHSNFGDSFLRMWKLDTLGCLLMFRNWNAASFVRNARVSARALLSPQSTVSAQELQARLQPESGLVMYQHNPPFWVPLEEVTTPMLWLAGEKDAFFSEKAERRSALHYKADYVIVKRSPHNIMMELGSRRIARYIHDWLTRQGIW